MSPRKSISQSSLGRRLRFAREACGFSTREVANQMLACGFKLTHATIGNYERGVTVPDEDLLHALTKIYSFPMRWLKGKGRELTGVRYRCLKATREYEKRAYEGQALKWLEAYMFVERLLKRRLKKKWVDFSIRSSLSGEQVAKKIRDMLRLGDYPLPSPVRLLQEFGVYVIDLSTDARIDGIATRFGSSRAVVLNSSVPSDRMRLNALHELAHHIYEDCVNDRQLESDEIERRAFDLASNVLIPDKMLKSAFKIKSIVRLVQYKERFGISMAAMLYRARRKDYITQREYQQVMITFSQRGFRKSEPGYVAPDRPARMETLIDSAIMNDDCNFEQLAAHSGLDVRDIQERLRAARKADLDNDNSTPTDSYDFKSYQADSEPDGET